MTTALRDTELKRLKLLRERMQEIEDEERRDRCERSLYEFVKEMWPQVEPSNPLVPGWVMEAICLHLEAVTNGDIKRLIINVPPGFSKSLLSDVFWPAWEWGPRNRPATRYLAVSYSSSLTERDNRRLIALVQSKPYQRLWGERFKAEGGETLVKTNLTGWKLATSIGGVGTGERGDRVILDDPNNVKRAESEKDRDSVIQWVQQVMPTRLNDISKSAIICIQQRTHEEDATGVLLSGDREWTHLMVPMRYEPTRHCSTDIGWSDPRTVEGELAWPERFPERELRLLESDLGVYATSGQLQQNPEPRGGGIIKRSDWQLWPPPHEEESWTRLEYSERLGREVQVPLYPPFSYIIVSVDGAYTAKEENDWSACTAWGIFQDRARNNKIMLIEAWHDRLELHGLVRRVMDTCKRAGRAADLLLIEDKASGHSVAQEIKRLSRAGDFSIKLVTPKGDKVSRLYSVQPLFNDGVVFAPDRPWADMVISEISAVPKGKHDDLADCSSQALNYLRKVGLATLRSEQLASERSRNLYHGEREPLYDV